jgi:hypothetical protein
MKKSLPSLKHPALDSFEFILNVLESPTELVLRSVFFHSIRSSWTFSTVWNNTFLFLYHTRIIQKPPVADNMSLLRKSDIQIPCFSPFTLKNNAIIAYFLLINCPFTNFLCIYCFYLRGYFVKLMKSRSRGDY